MLAFYSNDLSSNPSKVYYKSIKTKMVKHFTFKNVFDQISFRQNFTDRLYWSFSDLKIELFDEFFKYAQRYDHVGDMSCWHAMHSVGSVIVL